MLQNLSDKVEEIVRDFMNAGTLFTALDVSNKVKETEPSARHRDVRDLVRDLWTSLIEPWGYCRTPISVTLADGSSVQALLYHHLTDSSDLDIKYDQQKRNQTAFRSTDPAPAPVSQPLSQPLDGTLNQTTQPQVTLGSSAPKVTSSNDSEPKSMAEIWQKLFETQTSLFPSN